MENSRNKKDYYYTYNCSNNNRNSINSVINEESKGKERYY